MYPYAAGRYGLEPGCFNSPLSLAVGPDGSVVVHEFHRVQVFATNAHRIVWMRLVVALNLKPRWAKAAQVL